MVGVSFLQLSPLIHQHCRRAHGHRELPIWKGLVCHNPSGYNYLSPGGRSRYGWNVFCRVSFVQIYRLFCCRRCLARSFRKSPFGKGWVGCNPSGNYDLRPDRRSRRGLSCLSTNISSFFCCRRCIHSCS